jgi:predicted flap endonuclease-1-like 5' DNA nuclease
MIYLIQTLGLWLLFAFLLGLIFGAITCGRVNNSWFSFRTWVPWGFMIFAIGLVIAILQWWPGRAGLWLDSALLFFGTYILGCIIGCGGAQLLGTGDGAMAHATPAPAPAAARTATPAPALATPVAAVAAPAAQAVAKPFTLRAMKDAAGLTLTGMMPSVAVRDGLLGAARKATGGTVTDATTLAGGAPAGFEAMANAGLGHLGQLNSGVFALSDTTYSLMGAAPDASTRTGLMSAVKALPGGFGLGAVNITAPAPAAPAPAPAAPVAAAPVAAAAVPAEETMPKLPGEDLIPGKRPRGLKTARGGKPDDLKRIRGIGPQNEARLHALGIWHFDQIGAWTREEIDWVGNYLAFPGRIDREEWVPQAKNYAGGGTSEFDQRYARGEVTTSLGHIDEAQAFDGSQPKSLPKPTGPLDDLKLINGVGRAIEEKLHQAGIWSFDQIARMSDAELRWVSTYVGFPGRAIRENWAGECRILAAGGETEHSKAVKAGKIPSSLDDPDKKA